MKQMTRKQYWLLALMLTLCCGTTMVSACSKDDEPSEQNEISAIADKIWDYSLSHPDGFTLDIRTMTEPSEGISVSYAATLRTNSMKLSSSARRMGRPPFTFCKQEQKSTSMNI